MLTWIFLTPPSGNCGSCLLAAGDAIWSNGRVESGGNGEDRKGCWFVVVLRPRNINGHRPDGVAK